MKITHDDHTLNRVPGLDWPRLTRVFEVGPHVPVRGVSRRAERQKAL